MENREWKMENEKLILKILDGKCLVGNGLK